MRTRVLRHPLDRWIDPADAYSVLCDGADNAFWLDSGIDAAGGRSYIGTSDRVLTAGEEPFFDRLRAELGSIDVAETARDDPDGGFRLGWVGWLGYELRGETMGTPAGRARRYPDAALMFADRAVAFDHAAGTVELLALAEPGCGDADGDDGWTGALAQWRDATVGALRGAPAAGERSAPMAHDGAESTAPTVTWRDTDAEYLDAIAACQAAIRDGEAYQLCLTTEASIDARPDPFTTYLALRRSSPSHHGGLISIGGVALLSASPEQFLAVSPGGVVESSPIKGTRRRGANRGEDEALLEELLASDKERAENLMIVDLMRNDIGRISSLGSVEVPRLLVVESYAHVHQLVSTVRGQLSPGRDAVDAVVACFPAGSMTGAPKRNATLILDSLERRSRGLYAGAFGYFGLDGRVDLAMVIRSIVIDAHGATVGAGGGITALSVPAEELDEVRLKAAALLAVLGVGAAP